jgi:hypothetical protein
MVPPGLLGLWLLTSYSRCSLFALSVYWIAPMQRPVGLWHIAQSNAAEKHAECKCSRPAEEHQALQTNKKSRKGKSWAFGFGFGL